MLRRNKKAILALATRSRVNAIIYPSQFAGRNYTYHCGRDYKDYYRKDERLFIKLLGTIEVHVSRKNTVMRLCLSAKERLALTLRNLATGRSFEDLKFTAINSISAVLETCEAIIYVLQDYIQGWDELFMEQILGIIGFTLFYNYLFGKPINEGPFDIFVQQEQIRSHLHVGNLTFNTPEKVMEYMTEDFMKSVKPWFESLLENYQTVLYSAQLDLIVPYPGTENFLQTTQWSVANEFKNATRYPWKVDHPI